MLDTTLLKNWVIVVIDDHPDNAQVVQDLLEIYGAVVHSAENGREGLKLIEKLRPHLVICDLAMPVMTGWQMIEAMQQDRSLADIPVIALTGSTLEADRGRAIAAGFSNFIMKPLDTNTFVKQVLKLLKG